MGDSLSPRFTKIFKFMIKVMVRKGYLLEYMSLWVRYCPCSKLYISMSGASFDKSQIIIL